MDTYPTFFIDNYLQEMGRKGKLFYDERIEQTVLFNFFRWVKSHEIEKVRKYVLDNTPKEILAKIDITPLAPNNNFRITSKDGALTISVACTIDEMLGSCESMLIRKERCGLNAEEYCTGCEYCNPQKYTSDELPALIDYIVEKFGKV